LMAYCVREKGDKNALAFFKARFGDKTLEQKRTLLAALAPDAQSAPAPPAPARQPITPPAQEVIEGEIVEATPTELSHIRQEIDALIAALKSAGCAPAHIDAKIAKIAKGVYAIDEIADEDLPKVRQMLNNYATSPISAAAEMAKEFKPKGEK